jgi:hypothetical protein
MKATNSTTIDIYVLLLKWRYDIQHNDIQHNDIQRNNIQHNDIQHNDIQHNAFVPDTHQKQHSALMILSKTTPPLC